MAFKIKKALPSKGSSETTNESGEGPVEGEVLTPGAAMASLPGVEPVDRMFVASENAFDALQRHKNLVIGAVGALVLGIVAFGAFKSLAAQRAYDDSRTVFQVAAQTYAPVGDAAGAGEFWAQGDPIFADQAARNSGRTLAASQAIEGTKAGAQRVARLLHASALVESGKGESASAELKTFRAGAVNNLERLVADFALATATAASGDLNGALSQLDAIASGDAELALVVDEQRASLVDTFGTPEDALTMWRAIAESQKGSALGEQAASRVLQLEILTASVAR